VGGRTVVLTVVGPNGEVTKAVKTGWGNDRAGNILEFAGLALWYLLVGLEGGRVLLKCGAIKFK